MTREEVIAKAKEVMAFLVNDKTLKKHIYRNTLLTPNENYEVYPVEAWRQGIVIQLSNGRTTTEYTLRGTIKRVMEKYSGLIEWVRVGSYDGSCPREMTIRWHEWFYDEFNKTDLAAIRYAA